MNYYNILDISVSIQPNAVELKQHFMALSKQFHPDRYGQATAQEQAIALEKTSAINQAYATLSKPYTALQYYLMHHGYIATDEEYKLSPNFLMEMMELNEELEFADISTKEKIATDIKQKQELLTLQIIETCQQATVDIALVKEHYYKLKYYNRLLGA